jgi:dimethylargininase
MMVGDHFFIGLTDRTNREGAEQMLAILEKYNLSGSVIPIPKPIVPHCGTHNPPLISPIAVFV